jgi:cytochrome P450 family 135
MSQITASALPPGPRLPKWLQTIVFLRYWPRFVPACRRRYGKVFMIRAVMTPPMVYLAEPAEIKKVFAGDPSVFHAGEANAMLGGLLGDSSVLVVDDDVHRERRRVMLPPFHRDAVARQTQQMADIAAANIDGWPVGEPFAVQPKTSEITLEVILRTVIGASDPARLTALRAVMPKLLNVGPWASTDCYTPKSRSAARIRTSTSGPTRWPCWCEPSTRTGTRSATANCAIS